MLAATPKALVTQAVGCLTSAAAVAAKVFDDPLDFIKYCCDYLVEDFDLLEVITEKRRKLEANLPGIAAKRPVLEAIGPDYSQDFKDWS